MEMFFKFAGDSELRDVIGEMLVHLQALQVIGDFHSKRSFAIMSILLIVIYFNLFSPISAACERLQLVHQISPIAITGAPK